MRNIKLHNNSTNVFESVRHANEGFTKAFWTQRNIKIEVLMLILSLGGSEIYNIELWRTMACVISILFLISAELINTSIEFLTDLVTEGKWMTQAKYVKDIAAAAVLTQLGIVIVVHVAVYLEMLAIYLAK